MRATVRHRDSVVVDQLDTRHRLTPVGRLTTLLLARLERRLQQQVVRGHPALLLVMRRLFNVHLLHRSFYIPHTHTPRNHDMQLALKTSKI